MVLCVYYPDVTGWVDSKFLGPVKGGSAGGPTVAGVALRRRPRDRRNCAGVGADDPEPIPLALEDVDRAVRSDFDGAGTPVRRVGRQSAVAVVASLSGTGECRYPSAGEIHPP